MHILNINCLGLGPNSSKIFCNFRWSYPQSGQSLTKFAFKFYETFRLRQNQLKKYFLFSRTFFSFELYVFDCVKFINAQGYLQSISGYHNASKFFTHVTKTRARASADCIRKEVPFCFWQWQKSQLLLCIEFDPNFLPPWLQARVATYVADHESLLTQWRYI